MISNKSLNAKRLLILEDMPYSVNPFYYIC